MKKAILILLMLSFSAAILSSCAADPRKNCNHPQHGQYMNEKIMKKRGIKF